MKSTWSESGDANFCGGIMKQEERDVLPRGFTQGMSGDDFLDFVQRVDIDASSLD